MHELYSDDYAAAAGGRPGGLIPEPVRRAAGAVVFVGLIATMGIWAYRLGTRDAAEVPIIRAMEGPARIQPEDPGGDRAAHQGLEVNTVLSGEPAPVPRAAPAAEDLAAETLLAEEDAPRAELPERAELQEPQPGDLEAEAAAGAPGFVGPAPDLRTAAEARAEDGAAPAAAESAVAAAVAMAVAEAEASSDAAEEEPASASLRPRSRPEGRTTTRTAAVAPETAAPEAAASEAAARPAVPPSREVGTVGAGARLVQLGAFDNAEITRAAWETLVVRHGDLLADKSLYVERTTANARVFYRLRVAGFDSSDETREMCEALRARGVDCIPVTTQ